jgi:hypothetical protein
MYIRPVGANKRRIAALLVLTVNLRAYTSLPLTTKAIGESSYLLIQIFASCYIYDHREAEVAGYNKLAVTPACTRLSR